MKWNKVMKVFAASVVAILTIGVVSRGFLPVNTYGAPTVTTSSAAVEVTPAKPEAVDVIVIQSEAFIDITKVEEMTFSKEPLTHYKLWREKSQHGLLKVPVNGGLTCNSEFELLTGIRQNSISYLTFVDRVAKQKEKVNSLAWLLKANGYSTLGIHPHLRTYFNRDVVYPLMGIDKFISVENFPEPKRYGSWVRDKDDFDMVLKQLNKGTKKKFIFNVTVQNHAPFCAKPEPITVTSKAFVNDEDKISMQNYATGLYQTDLELDRFMKAIDKRERRTIVVFYGDHQPTKNHKSFANMEYFKKNGYYTTEYFIYDNKGKLEKQNKDIALIQMRYEIEAAIGIQQDTALKAYVVTEGYSAYDNIKVTDMQEFYKGENRRLR